MLRAGDYFSLTDETGSQRFIRFGCSVLSLDGMAEYGHCGIITSPEGDTFEVRWDDGYCRGNLFRDYPGRKIFISRHRDMTPEAFERGMAGIQHLEGKRYPKLRFLPFCFPLLPKFIHLFNKPVCSELVFMHGTHAKLKRFTYWWGVTPDRASEALDAWREFETVPKEEWRN